MNRSDSPKKQPKPFGVNGQRVAILPTTPAGDNSASYEQGFPPITMILKSAGGLPPKGQDMNQILYELSALGRWSSTGALNTFDSEFASEISGYPSGAMLISDDGERIFINTTEGNLSDPNSNGTGWKDILSYLGIGEIYAPINSPSFTGTPSVPTADQSEIDFRIANTAFVAQAIAILNGGAPAALNTLKKLALAINNDASFYSTVNNALGQKAALSDFTYSKTSSSVVGNQPGGLRFMCGETSVPTDSNGNVFITLPDTFLNRVVYAEAHQSKGSYTADVEPFIFSSYPASNGPTSTISFAVRNSKTGVPLINSAINLQYFVKGY